MEYLMMMRKTTLIIVALLIAPAVNAEPSSAVAFDVPTLKMLKAADADAGKELAREKKCKKCHGKNGVSDDPDDINIAGMSASYLYKQLKDYQDKKRDDRDINR